MSKEKIPYREFINKKLSTVKPSGFDVRRDSLHSSLKVWQGDIVKLALQRGKCALFEDCGLGKSFQSFEWAQQVINQTGGNVLIAAPLGVALQTVSEGKKFGYSITLCRTQEDVEPGLNVTNYDRLDKFDPNQFSGFVLDESSILKSFSGETRKQLNEFASSIPYRLACTATPAPNDLIELINHAEFLGISSGKEIIAQYFIQDGNTTHAWRLRNHAKKRFWEWVSQWAVVLRKPSDLGYSDEGYTLPPLNIQQITVDITDPLDAGMLFAVEAHGLDEQRKARKASLSQRVEICAKMVNGISDPCAVWCELNAEGEALSKEITEAIEVTGSDSPEYKEKMLLGFANGDFKTLVTKPEIAGFGLNYQHCNNVFVVGLGNSYEKYYQLIRRFWRFGQTKPVNVHVIVSNMDGAIVENIQRKEKQAAEMFDEIVKATASNVMSQLSQTVRQEMEIKTAVTEGNDYKVFLGDSVETMVNIPDESIHFTVFSPPFPGLYVYNPSMHDIGNSEHIDTMIEHFRYLVDKDHLLRIMKPGRLCAIHLMQLTAMKSRDGYIGIKDYRGRVIAMMEEEGWIYAGEVTIDKNPQIQATRNKERGLLFKTLATDSANMRMALADYLIYFRKPGDNQEPIKAGMSGKYNPGAGWITESEWIEWASPVWYRQTPHYPGGIRETDVLNVRAAKETDDERHLCPLQLGVVERAVKLWSAPGETVYSPFMGIGSEGYQSLLLNRKFIGSELKESYYRVSIDNLEFANQQKRQTTLFDFIQEEQHSFSFESLSVAAD